MPLMKTVMAANTIVRHSFKHDLKAKQGNAISSKCTVPGVERCPGLRKRTTIWIFLRRQKHGGNIMEVAILQAA